MAELRIMITLPLPDDMFERAIAIAQIKEPLDACAKALGEPPCRLEYEISDAKTPKVRKQRADKGQPRKVNGPWVASDTLPPRA